MRRVCVALLSVSAIALTLASCGGGATTPNPPPPPTPTRIIGLSGNLTFGSVQVGSTATSLLTIVNTGTASLTVSSLAMSQGLTGIYSANWQGGTIAAGGSQPVTLQFSPSSAQQYSGTLTVASDATSGTSTIQLSGTGTSASTPSCVYALSIGSEIDGYPGGTSLSGTVTTGTGCAWSTSSNATWLHVSGSGSGSGSFTVTLDPNTGSTTRTGAVTVGGQVVTVNQTSAACSYALNIGSSINADAGGTSQSVAVTAGTGCAWNVTSNATWIHASGSGNGTGSFSLTIDANTTAAARSGTFIAAGQTVTVNQAAAAAPAALSPSLVITPTVSVGANTCQIDQSGDSSNPALIRCVFDASASTPSGSIASYQFDLLNTGKTLGTGATLQEPKTACGFPFNAGVTIRLTITATDGRTATTTSNLTFTKLSTGPC